MYFYDNILLISPYNDTFFRQTCRESQNTRFMVIYFFTKILPFMR